MNALTIAALVIMAICTLRGWQRGFIMILYGVAAWIFIAVFVLISHGIIYNYYMGNDEIYDRVYRFTRPYVNKYVPDSFLERMDIGSTIDDVTRLLPDNVNLEDTPLSDIDVDKLKEYGVEVPEGYESIVDDALTKATEGANTVGDLVEGAKELAEGGAESIRDKAVDVATETIVERVLRILAVITAYLIAKIICVITKIVLTVISERTPIRMAVHLTGAALGWFESVLYIWIVLYAIRVMSVTDFGLSMAEQVRESALLSSLDANNMLGGFLSFLFGISPV